MDERKQILERLVSAVRRARDYTNQINSDLLGKDYSRLRVKLEASIVESYEVLEELDSFDEAQRLVREVENA